MSNIIPESNISLTQPEFIPTTRVEMDSLGWKQLDILLVSGDAYMDHPSFGIPLLGRLLIAHGYRVGIIAQPDWENPEVLLEMGRPRLYAGVSAGAIDSMLAHYTAFRKLRHDDAYTPGGKHGARPNRACIVYTNLVRRAFPGIPVVLGGIEASLRRITHYDFWTNKLRRSILLDSKADLVVYGMGEYAMLTAAKRLEGLGMDEVDSRIDKVAVRESLADIHGTVYATGRDGLPENNRRIMLPSHEEVVADAPKLVEATLQLESQVHEAKKYAVQECGGRFVVNAPPAPFLTEEDMDYLYDLPYARREHPSYDLPIPAMAMIAESITSHRGCGGGCSFCSLALHQGRRIRSRSSKSILREAKTIGAMHRKPCSISDVGGPSANMWQANCAKDPSKCKRKSCMFPTPCPSFAVKQQDQLDLLEKVAQVDRIKNVRVASGVRYDLALKEPKFLRQFIRQYVGGQLKVAPEHIADGVLTRMRKPGLDVFLAMLDVFADESRKAGKEQYVIPYLMSAFPGCTEKDMKYLKDWLHERGWKPQQVQCFIPTPGTVATAMYYAEVDEKGNPLFVAKTDAQRLKLHHLLMPTMGRKGDGGGRGDGNKGKPRKGGYKGQAGPRHDNGGEDDRPQGGRKKGGFGKKSSQKGFKKNGPKSGGPKSGNKKGGFKGGKKKTVR
ncbi:MAG: YgiQ family radical SAM protein [Desulfovibrio sp.]